MREYVVAILGATGAVGQEMLRVLEARNFPVGELRPLASERSAGQKVLFRGRPHTVQKASEAVFTGVDLALFSAGAERSREYAPIARDAGALVIDNSSAFRMQADVPLVVPEVNADAARAHQGLIANPNCSTIQMVVALEPLRRAFGLRRVTVATYQSVSGTGTRALLELERTSKQYLAGEPETLEVYPHPIAFECLPHIDVLDEQGNSREELKMRDETRKILSQPELPVVATCVRVPVFRSHSEAVVVETEQSVDRASVHEVLRHAPGIVLLESATEYPLARQAAGRDEVFVGRVRVDPTQPQTIALWVVSDNLRKGAATNAVQIAETVLCNEPVREA